MPRGSRRIASWLTIPCSLLMIPSRAASPNPEAWVSLAAPRRLTDVMEEESGWGWVRGYLSWVVREPLFPGLFFVGGYTFCHLVPHRGLHVSQHVVQPYFYLGEELRVRLRVPKKMCSVIHIFFHSDGGSEEDEPRQDVQPWMVARRHRETICLGNAGQW